MPDLLLEPLEGRVLGVLIEKERTTPDGYPLSLNALLNGCNQKSNRDPMPSAGERDVNDAILRLRVAGLVEFVQLAGQRVEKYRHKAGAALHLQPAELAVLAELLLRDAQQPGELRTRAVRMHPLPTAEALQEALDALSAKGLVVRHERRQGERTARWSQVLAPAAGTPRPTAPSAAPTPPPPPASAAASEPSPSASEPSATPVAVRPGAGDEPAPRTPVDAAAPTGLERRVARLEAEVAALRARLDRA
jgi:hypothetical protein